MADDTGASHTDAGRARDLGTAIKARVYPPNVKGWALIVGISKYQHEAWNLEYADRDAQKFAELIGTTAGGKFANIRLLVNEQATYAELNKALKTFLKKPDRDDIVVLYFACHGAPDPDLPDNIYLLAHDAEPADISGTALPMREIDHAVKETLRAERVVILADTCHSGGIGQRGGRRGTTESAVVNKYLNDLSEARGGIALLTSAAADETSREGKQWGEGHGVFTHFLLEGMRGQADGYGGKPRDGKVGVRELFEYVRDLVKKETNDSQHPVIGPDAFDPDLPMAITGEVDARQLYKLALELEHLAQLVDEPCRYRAAATQFANAIEFASKAESKYVDAEVGLGRCLTRAGDLEEAERVLERVIQREKDNAPAHAHFWRGVIRAMQRDREHAATAFKTFAERQPDDVMAAWAASYASAAHAQQDGQRFAVLIGINKYAPEMVPPLAGCVNDVRLMREALTGRFRLEQTNTVVLLDEQATRDVILRALADIAKRVRRRDQIVVSYSGHSVPESLPTAFGLPVSEGLYLVVHDTRRRGDRLDHGITYQELHAALKAIPAANKVLVLDTHPSKAFNALADSDGDYEVLLASDLAQITEEVPVKIDGVDQRAGLFTTALTEHLRQADPETVTCGELLDATIVHMKSSSGRQTPLLIGDRATPFFATDDVFLQAFQFAARRKYLDVPAHVVTQRYRRYSERLVFAFPSMHCSFGRAFLEKGRFKEAATALNAALAQAPGPYPDASIALARSQLATGGYDDLQITLQRVQKEVPASQASRAANALLSAQRLAACPKRALLIGISRYGNGMPPVEGAADDILAMKQSLVERFGFHSDHITVLTDTAATRNAVIGELSALADQARHEPALFFFAGKGSLSRRLSPTLVCADSRTEEVFDLELAELNSMCQKATNLVTILDCSWHGKTRSAPPDTRTPPGARGIGAWIAKTISKSFDELPELIAVGGLTIAARDALPRPSGDGSVEPEAPVPQLQPPGKTGQRGAHGRLTSALIRGMRSAPPGRLTFREWLDASSSQMEIDDPFLVNGTLMDEPVFESVTLRSEILSQTRSIDEAPLDELIESLTLLIDQRQRVGDTYPRGRLDLGIAYSMKGDLQKASDLLDRAVALYSDAYIMTRELERDPLAEQWFHEARFQLGRVLYKSNRALGRAVSELERVVEKEPESAAALYYYGQAIRAMVERDTLTKAQEVLRRYLEKGAPLGHEDEVREFLGSREALR